MRARFDVIIAGGQGDGKTTLLRALAAAIDPGERIVTIESDFELGLDRLPERHHEVIALEAREANVEGVGRVSCAELVRRAMRMSARRIIVGEVLGDEVLPDAAGHELGRQGQHVHRPRRLVRRGVQTAGPARPGAAAAARDAPHLRAGRGRASTSPSSCNGTEPATGSCPRSGRSAATTTARS